MCAVALRLPDDLSQRLDILAKRTGHSKTFYTIEAIAEHLEDLEDIYIAEESLALIDAGLSKAIPLEEVLKRFGSDD